MGQNVSTQSTPHFSTPVHGKGKSRRQTVDAMAPLPKRAKSIAKRHTLDQQLAARYMAEEKLEGRSPRLIILDHAASPKWGNVDDDQEVEGLRINVNGRKLDRPRTALDSTGSSISKFPSPLKRGLSSESLQITLPLSSHVIFDEQAGRHSPTSHWSESSTGIRTPPQTFQSFRESHQYSVTSTKRMSGQSVGRLSNIFSIDEAVPPTKPLQKAIEKGLNSYRLSKENDRKRKAAKKRGPIIVVGAQRVGSGRYSMMKEAAVRSAAARRESLASSDGLGLRRGSRDTQGRRRSSASEGRRATARRASDPTHSPSDTPKRPAPSSRRSSSHNDLMSFIAASPDLTCPDPNRPLFELQATPRPSIARLPAGHPGNHHSRFRAFNERVAALPPPPVVPAAVTGPVPLPARGVLSQRRASSLSSSARSSIVSIHPSSNLQNEMTLEGRRPSTVSSSSRKLSNYRLSIAEPRADGENEAEGQDAESRRGSANSWANASRGRSRLNSTEFGSSTRTEAGSGSEGSKARRGSSVSLSALVPAPDRRPSTSSVPFFDDTPPLPTTRSASLASRASFPHSVAYTSDSRDTSRRRGSAMSYFTLPTSHPDLPQSPESLPQNLAEALRTPRPADLGAISWDGYSLKTPPADLQPRNSVTSIATSDIAPETVDAFPLPPDIPRLRVHAPSPLILSRKTHQPFPYDTDSSDLVLSDVSTPSTASFDSSTATSISSGPKLDQEGAGFVIGTGEGFSHTLKALSSNQAPSSPTSSLGGHSGATFTMDDLVQPGPGSKMPREVVGAIPLGSAPSGRRPSQVQLETASPNLSLPTQPLPSPSNKRAPPPVFSDWKLRVDSTAAQLHRLPTVVSPTTDPFTSGYMDSDDEEEDEGDVSPSFVRVATTSKTSVSQVGAQSFLDCSPAPPAFAAQAPLPGPASMHLGLGVDVPLAAGARKNRDLFFPSREFGSASPRRGTHPLDWTPPSMRKSGGFEMLMEKGRSASEDHGMVRLGSTSKRGFNKSEVSDWLQRASRETVPVVR